MVCVIHINGDNFARRDWNPAQVPFRVGAKRPVQIRPKGVARVPRNRQERQGAPGRLDTCEPPLLWADGYPLTRASPAEPVPAPRPVLLMCDYHSHVGSYAILLSPPSGSRLITIYHAPFRVRRRNLRDIREKQAALSCQPAGVADGLRPQPGRVGYPGEFRVKCETHYSQKVLAVLPGG